MQAVESARRAEAEEQAHEQFQRFLGTGDDYVPVPVQAFH
jgi:conjugal transfer/entry exclusion protein